MSTINNNELLIASLTPQNLERGVLWFSENHQAIKRALITNGWWQKNALFIEKDNFCKMSELARKFLDLGYERVSHVRGKGLFTVRGGIIEIWPVNSDKPYLLEFTGNYPTLIQELSDKPEQAKPRLNLKTGLEELTAGSLVVHEDHGIGIFREIISKESLNGSAENFYVIEYAAPRENAEPDKLFVPVVQKDRLTPYIGFETPKIHRLGGSLWEKTKRKTKEDVEKLAKELAQLYAQRNVAKREPLFGDKSLEDELRSSFPHEETEDQIKAEQEILADFEKDTPMDRVLCGDVGFGKTELALRSAARVIASGRQVALLSPTTILACQHERTFKERFTSLPVNIKLLSRLVSSKEEKIILKELAEGKIDCIIGTHRLISGDIIFKNLGLVIIDEEQRFGVKQKERLKELRCAVDILSLSATPIPRTMHMVLSKLREFSFLSTPPSGRIPIQTFVLPFSAEMIGKAIRTELDRNGQVYFLHNRIETIGQVRKKLIKNVGHANQIGVLHGRMPEKEIICTMEKFRKGEIKILLATTIIENGLDIASANTLIVDDATRLGLAEAHQLRGRIGRGQKEAYAYFLYKSKNMTEKSTERLEALQEYSELGAGYELALRDLEIRGAGNLLGREQSGAINKIGLNLYYQMLGEAVEKEKILTV
ncbi:MAG: CarD family transcriptional regulator [bacterium]|nr:CarD family transcriptional regulator [bacterium]